MVSFFFCKHKPKITRNKKKCIPATDQSNINKNPVSGLDLTMANPDILC